MKAISIDIETRSSVDIGKSGVYRYAEADDFAILLFGYAVDGGEVNVVELANGEEIPQEIRINPDHKAACWMNIREMTEAGQLPEEFGGEVPQCLKLSEGVTASAQEGKGGTN